MRIRQPAHLADLPAAARSGAADISRAESAIWRRFPAQRVGTVIRGL